MPTQSVVTGWPGLSAEQGYLALLKPWQSFRAVKGQECQDRTSGQLTTNYSLPELQCTQASPKPTHGGCKVTIWTPGVAELPCPSCHMLGGILIRRLTELASLNPQRCVFFWWVKDDQRGGQGMSFCQAEGAGCEPRFVFLQKHGWKHNAASRSAKWMRTQGDMLQRPGSCFPKRPVLLA